MKTSDAKKMGHKVKRVKQPPKAAEPVPAPAPAPVVVPDVKVVINNDAVADAIAQLAAKIEPPVDRASDAQVLATALKEVVKDIRPVPGRRVVSCDMTHEYKNVGRAPTSTKVLFHYDKE
jgi:hypothetical protein